jgi:predicted nuclease with RNAse H fold
MTFIGIDLRASYKRPSVIAALDFDSQLIHLGTFLTEDELFRLTESLQPGLISIGAPTGLPKGLDCLEPDCPERCQPDPPDKTGRTSELELSRMGIGCFFTSKKSITKGLIYRSIKLKNTLSKSSSVIEVYPHGTKVILFGDKVPPKSNLRHLPFLKERLPGLIKGLEPRLDSLNCNACDALINAYTTLLHARNETDILGIPEEGLLALPKLPR